MKNSQKKKPVEHAAWTQFHQRLYNAIIAFSGLLYICVNLRYETGFVNDDAVYVITARDFWKTALRHPLLGIKPDFPLPGLPLFLAPFVRLVAPRWTLIEYLSIAVTMVSVYLLGKWIRKWLSPVEALVAMAFFAFNPVVAKFSGVIVPGPYYCLAVIVCFYLTDELLHKSSPSKALALGFIMGWGSVLRPESVVLTAALCGAMLLSHRGRRLLRFIVIPLVAWAGFLWLWFQTRRTLHTEFGGDVNALLDYWPHHLLSAVPFSFELAQAYLSRTWTWMRLLPSNIALHIGQVVVVLVLIGIMVGFKKLWINRKDRHPMLTAMAIFCVAYFLVHVFWHVPEQRYLIPIFPFVVILFVIGAGEILSSLRFSRALITTFVILLFLPLLYDAGRVIHNAFLHRDPMSSPPWRTLTWLRENSPPSARITSNIPSSVELYADRNSTGVITIDNADEFLYLLLRERLSYIVFRDVISLTPGVGETEDPNEVFVRYRRWIHFYPERLPSVFTDAVEQAGIYRIVYPPRFRESYEEYISASDDANGGRYNDALQKVNAALGIYPGLGCAVNLRGALYFLGRNISEAEKNFLRAETLTPDSSNLMLNLAGVYHQKGQKERRDEYLKKGAEIASIAGNIEEFEENRRNLESLWAQGKTTLFFKAPHTHLYDQIRE